MNPIEGIQGILWFVHAKVNEVNEVDYPLDMTPQFCYWAQEVSDMSFLFVCHDNADAGHHPACRASTIPLAQTLSLDL